MNSLLDDALDIAMRYFDLLPDSAEYASIEKCAADATMDEWKLGDTHPRHGRRSRELMGGILSKKERSGFAFGGVTSGPGNKCFWRRLNTARPSPAVHNGACRG